MTIEITATPPTRAQKLQKLHHIPRLQETINTIRDSRGSNWIGITKADQPWNGVGSIVFKTCRYDGLWIKGQLVYGLYMSCIGDNWYGTFRNYRPWDGKGIYNLNGFPLKGIWKDGFYRIDFTPMIETPKKIYPKEI